MNTATWLPLAWGIILSLVILMYVLLDGFDLGLAILFPWVKEHQHRDIMMNSVSPVWDGNETWLVLGGSLLYAAFPLAYGTLLPTLYIPVIIMLLALVFRGVAFEFRFKSNRSRLLWDIAFSGGSLVAAFCQGVTLGTFVYGYVGAGQHTLSTYEWLTPFSVTTGIAVVCGYALLGATWLIMKTTGELQAQMRRYAKRLLIIVALFMVIVSIWTPLGVPFIRERWFSLPQLFFFLPLPMFTLVVFAWNWFALQQEHEIAPFCLSIVLFILAYVGFCISDFPYIVPHTITIWQAASAPSSQLFLLIGAAILLPILISYTAYSYYIFRGKASAEHHY